jgi:hypothetical protein
MSENKYIYDTGNGERDESRYRQEHARVTAEFERIKPMFNGAAGFNNRIFNKVFEHMKSKGPEDEAITEPEALPSSVYTYGTAEDGGQQMLKEDREIRGMTQLERAYRAHTNPDAYTESVIERCKSKPDVKERPLTSQEAQKKIDAYRQLYKQEERPLIQIQPIKPPPPPVQPPPQQQAQFMPPPQPTQFMAPPPQIQQHPQFMAPPPPQHPQFMAPPPQQHPQFMAPPPQQHPQFMAPPPQQHPQFMAPMQQQHPQFMAPMQQQIQRPPQYMPPSQQYYQQASAPQFQSDFYVPPPQPQIVMEPAARPRAPVAQRPPQHRQHRRENSLVTFTPDDYRFYTQPPPEEQDEEPEVDLKSIVKKQDMLIKLLLQQRKFKNKF